MRAARRGDNRVQSGGGRRSAVPRDRPVSELIGDLAGPVATVDRAGSVCPLGAGWRICWGVGAGDRWRVAAEEAAVRSRLVDDMPVTATSMRVPGGDVVQQAAAVGNASGRAVILEFLNEAPVPVTLALAVCGEVERAAVRGSVMMADGLVALELGRTPGGAVAAAGADVWTAVRAGPPAGDCETRSRSGHAAAAMLVPLASRVPLRVTVPVTGGAVPAGLPEAAVRGWRAVVDRAASLETSDSVDARAWRRGVAAATLAAGASDVATAARAAVMLDRIGLPDEADRGRETLLAAADRLALRDRPGWSAAEAVAVLAALASRRLRAGRESGLATFAGPLAAAAGGGLDVATLEQVAAALDVEAPAAARDARGLLARTGRTAAPGAGALPAPSRRAVLGTEAVRRCAAFGGDGLAGLAVLLDGLVAEAADHLVVAPALHDARAGSTMDVRLLATRHGRLSFSVRWHGSRPALLWELAPFDGAGRASATADLCLRCGLDPAWSTARRAGEALLGADHLKS